MLNKKTVLVLGAGASAPFSFPTGIQLSDRLKVHLQNGHEAYGCLIQCGFSHEQITDFRDAFFYSGKNSVDAFLEHRTDYVEIGKLATAALLIPFEQSESLFRYENNWLRYIYNNLNTTFDEFIHNQLSIITFNYDRSVEHFFFTSLKNTYRKTDEECANALRAIQPIHLHGRLGHLPWQNSEGSRPFEPTIGRRAIRTGASELKIIHEDIRDGRDKDFAEAKNRLAQADQIVFLGFGFNQTNVERLGICGLAEGKAVATRVGLLGRELNAISTMCDAKVHFVGGDCLEVVREQISWE